MTVVTEHLPVGPVGGQLWPWQAEPYRLWSLLEMLRFYAATFAVVMTNMERVTMWLGSASFQGQDTSEPLAQVLVRLREVQGEVSKLPVSIPFQEQLKRIIQRVEAVGPSPHLPEVSAITALCDELKKTLITEIAQHLFFVVPDDHKWIYLDPGKWFGASALNSFAGIDIDVRDACQCFALAQWTASVFHSMRILERGLHALAKELGVTFPADIELENWKNIIDKIEKAIRDKEQEPKGAAKSALMKFYSEGAAQFRYFKEAWRNHVSHSRINCDEQEALAVLTHVKDFMNHLAKGRP